MNDFPALPGPDDESLVGQVADEFTERLHRGEQPDVEEYARRYPEIAALLREALPALQAVALLATDLAVPPAAPAAAPPSGCLGDYRLLREVGRGGMGIVYEAEQISLRRRVALKVLPFAAALDAKQLQRFKNEAQAAACLHHTSIVPVYAVGCERGVHYYAMQFIDGRTVGALLRELRSQAGLGTDEDSSGADLGLPTAPLAAPGPNLEPPPDEAPAASGETPPPAAAVTDPSTRKPAHFRTVAQLGVQAARALEHAHQLGVVHRDIKPANLLLDVRGNLWITDFGLARLRGNDAGLTLTGDLLGTLRYMSPEQALGKRVLLDHRTDLYSLGVTLYELLTLEPACPGGDREEVLRRIAFEEPRPPRRLNPAVPAELETIILKAMAKHPEERYATAEELADDLQRFLEDRPIRARRPGLAQRTAKWARRHRSLVVSLSVSLPLLFLGVLVAVLGYAFNQHDLARARADLVLEKEQLHRNTAEQLYRTLLNQASALRLARRPGYRGEVWDDLRAAVGLDLPGKDLQKVRDQALACLGDPIGLDPRNPPPAVVRAAPPPLSLAFQELLQHQPAGKSVHVVCSAGDLLATAAYNSVTVCRKDGRKCGQTEAPLGAVYDLKFTPDGQLLVAGCEEGAVVWDVPRLTRRSFFRGGVVRSVAVHPGGHLLATAGRQLELWSLASNRPVASFQSPVEGERVEFSADGKFLLAVHEDLVYTAWPVSDTPEKQYLEGHRRGVPAVAFSPDGRVLASASKDQHVKLWDTGRGILLRDCGGHEQPIEALAFSPDGQLLASGDFGGTICLWEVATGRRRATFGDKTCPGQIWRLQFDPAGRYLAAAGQSGVVAWPVRADKKGKPTTEPFLNLSMPKVYDLAIHPGGTELVFLDETPRPSLYAYDLEHALGPRLLDVRCCLQIRGLHFDASGRQLTYVTDQRKIGLWDWAPGGPGRELPQDGYQLAVSRGGRWIATSNRKHEVVVCDRDAGRPFFTFPAESSEVWSLAWSPDATRLAVGLSDGGLVVWDLAQVARQLAELGLPRPEVGVEEVLPPETPPGGGPPLERLVQANRERAEAENELCWWETDALLGKLSTRPSQARQEEDARRRAIHRLEERARGTPASTRDRERLATAHNRLGLALQAGKKYEAAEEAFRQAARLAGELAADHPGVITYPRTQAAYQFNLARLLLTTSRFAEAEDALRRALGLDPAHPAAHNVLAWLLATAPDTRQRRPAEAIVLARKAVELAPTVATFYNTLGVAHYRAGDWDAARTALEKGVELGEDVNAYDGFFLAMTYWRQGDRPKARTSFDRAVAWADAHRADDEELRRFRAEAAALLGVEAPAVEGEEGEAPDPSPGSP